MTDYVTITMNLDTYRDMCNLFQKRDEKRVKMRERYHQNKAKTVDKNSNLFWVVHQPTFEIEVVSDIFEPR